MSTALESTTAETSPERGASGAAASGPVASAQLSTGRASPDGSAQQRAPRDADGASPAAGLASRARTTGARAGIVVMSTLALFGVLLLGFGGYLVLLSPIQQSRTQETLYDTLAGDLRLAVVPVDGVIPGGAPVAVLEIPALGLRQVVVEGTTSADLMDGPGHRRDTPLPGQAGTSVIYGRSALFGGPFADLTVLRAGDRIIVTTGQAESTFEVSAVRLSTDPVPPPSGAAGTLVLSTANPPLRPTESLLLTADLVTDVLPGRPDTVAIPAAERSLAGDPAAALPLMLWSQALLIVVAAASWGFLRWERWPTYVIALPVLLAVLWNVYENCAQLLPNTM